MEYDSTVSYSPQKSVERAPSSVSGRKSVRYTVQPRANRTASIYTDDGQGSML